ncbi:MAG: recombinase family protein, partial [Pseudonocardiaceae bacterium]
MGELLVDYARCSTDFQDLTVQIDGLTRLGVDPQRVYVDHGLTGTTRARPGLREALAAVRAGDTLVVTKLDRLARSVPDARAIADELTAREVKLNIGGSVHDPTDPIGRLLFTGVHSAGPLNGHPVCASRTSPDTRRRRRPGTSGWTNSSPPQRRWVRCRSVPWR